MDDVPLVGGKNASQGERYRGLTSRGVKVPNGFATIAKAYRHYLRHNRLDERIGEALATLDQARPETVQAAKTTGALETYHLQHRGSVLAMTQLILEVESELTAANEGLWIRRRHIPRTKIADQKARDLFLARQKPYSIKNAHCRA